MTRKASRTSWTQFSRLMIHNGYKGTQSKAGKAHAIIAMAHRQLSDVMYHFRRSKGLGRRLNNV